MNNHLGELEYAHVREFAQDVAIAQPHRSTSGGAMAQIERSPLASSLPHAGLRGPLRPRPEALGERRTLSEKQRRLPFFAQALATLHALPQRRDQLLPRLARLNPSGRRTRIEVYENLAAAAEPILARYDLATGVLGWLDEGGNFRLNSQCRIAADSGLPPACLNRLFKHMDRAGYVVRRLQLVAGREHGVQFVRTRVLIRFTDLFWRQLGLSLKHALARKAARKRRARRVDAINEARLGRFKQKEAMRKAREMKRPRQSSAPPAPNENYQRRRVEVLLQLRASNPTLDAAAINAMADAILSNNS